MTTENIYVSVIPLPLATDNEFIESVNTFAVKPDMADLNLLQRSIQHFYKELTIK